MQETLTTPENQDGAADMSRHNEELGRKYSNAKGAVGDLAGEVGSTVKDRAGAMQTQAAEWAKEKANRLKEQAADSQAAIISTVRRHPLQSLAIAAGAGLLLGLLLHRGD